MDHRYYPCLANPDRDPYPDHDPDPNPDLDTNTQITRKLENHGAFISTLCANHIYSNECLCSFVGLSLSLGVGLYSLPPQSVSFSTFTPSNGTQDFETSFEATVGRELMLGETATVRVNVTLLEGTADVKVLLGSLHAYSHLCTLA